MTTTFCTSGQALVKAGKNVSTDFTDGTITDSQFDDYINEAESEINVHTKYNWTDAFSGLDTDVKGILQAAASNLTAIYCITYDMSGFTSRIEAEDMINVLRDALLRELGILRDKKNQSFLNDPTTGVV